MKEEQKEPQTLNGVNLTWVERWVKNGIEERITKNELVLQTLNDGKEIYILRKQGVTTYRLESVLLVGDEVKNLIKLIRNTESLHTDLIRQLRKFMVKTDKEEQPI